MRLAHAALGRRSRRAPPGRPAGARNSSPARPSSQSPLPSPLTHRPRALIPGVDGRCLLPAAGPGRKACPAPAASLFGEHPPLRARRGNPRHAPVRGGDRRAAPDLAGQRAARAAQGRDDRTRAGPQALRRARSSPLFARTRRATQNTYSCSPRDPAADTSSATPASAYVASLLTAHAIAPRPPRAMSVISSATAPISSATAPPCASNRVRQARCAPDARQSTLPPIAPTPPRAPHRASRATDPGASRSAR